MRRFWLGRSVKLPRERRPASRLHHLAVTYDGKTVKVYLNGKLHTESQKALSVQAWVFEPEAQMAT